MNKHKVFISHSTKDMWIAKQIGSRITEIGGDYFLDGDHIDFGDDFEEIIVEQANNSDELFVLMSPWAKDSKYIWLEIGIFMGAKKRTVFALHGQNVLELSEDPRIPLVLKKSLLVELNDIEEYFEQLEDRIESKTNG